MTNSTKQQLLIIESNQEVAHELKEMIHKRFFNMFHITVYNDGFEAAERCNHTTDIVIINKNIIGENGTQLTKTIQMKNPNLKLFLMANPTSILDALDRYYNIKVPPIAKVITTEEPKSSWIRRSKYIYPLRYMMKELRIKKILKTFLLIFIVLAGVSLVSLFFI
jgi:DNA-binding NtrC family response regulator